MLGNRVALGVCLANPTTAVQVILTQTLTPVDYISRDVTQASGNMQPSTVCVGPVRYSIGWGAREERGAHVPYGRSRRWRDRREMGKCKEMTERDRRGREGESSAFFGGAADEGGLHALLCA